MKESINALIIDDDSDDQEIFLMCLKSVSEDIVCRTANNGIDAIDMFESQTGYIPDYIFLDVNMPKMNGIECLSHLRKIELLRKTKIFMYSTTSENTVVGESINLGAEGFLIKPAKPSVLREKLAKIFNVAWDETSL